jgi:2,3-bisphosphoglycerate-dependent phosphoglycerate mutase
MTPKAVVAVDAERGTTLLELIAVRHGESAAGPALAKARANRRHDAGLDLRDADVGLTELGRTQATALGAALAARPAGQAVTAVVSSPYVRAAETARALLDRLGRDAAATPRLLVDERLRDRELGVLELLTPRGINAKYPDEARRRRHFGDFYYRPPGGESLVDVALRLRTFLADLRADAPGERVLVVAHDAVVLMLRYILESLTEHDLARIIADTEIGNASITRWESVDGHLVLRAFNELGHLQPA